MDFTSEQLRKFRFSYIFFCIYVSLYYKGYENTYDVFLLAFFAFFFFLRFSSSEESLDESELSENVYLENDKMT